MLVYLLPPILIALFLAGGGLVSIIIGLSVLRSGYPRLAPFFFCVPPCAAGAGIVFAWPVAVIAHRINPDGSYAQFLLGFPIGIAVGGAVGLLVAWLIRRRIRKQS